VFAVAQSMLFQQLRKSDEVGLAFAIPNLRNAENGRAGKWQKHYKETK
jgi:hypothetical protein